MQSVEKQLDAGTADEVVELCEFALPELEEVLSTSADDSDGSIGDVHDMIQQLHLKACQIAQPDPEDLARRLFQGQMNSGFSAFSGAVNSYGDLLGKRGREIYRQFIECEWERLPALKSEEKKDVDYKHKTKRNFMKLLKQKEW